MSSSTSVCCIILIDVFVFLTHFLLVRLFSPSPFRLLQILQIYIYGPTCIPLNPVFNLTVVPERKIDLKDIDGWVLYQSFIMVQVISVRNSFCIWPMQLIYMFFCSLFIFVLAFSLTHTEHAHISPICFLGTRKTHTHKGESY